MRYLLLDNICMVLYESIKHKIIKINIATQKCFTGKQKSIILKQLQQYHILNKLVIL